jgi:hypothetical protein
MLLITYQVGSIVTALSWADNRGDTLQPPADPLRQIRGVRVSFLSDRRVKCHSKIWLFLIGDKVELFPLR